MGTGGCRTGQAGARRACVPSTLSPASHICMCELQRTAWGPGARRLSQLRTRLASQTRPRPTPEDSTFCPGGTGQGLLWASQRWQNRVTPSRGRDPRPGCSCPQLLCDSAPSPPLADLQRHLCPETHWTGALPHVCWGEGSALGRWPFGGLEPTSSRLHQAPL